VAKKKDPTPEDPDKLKREHAGRYVTPDGRFAVEGNSTGSWYVVDAARQNELGLPLMQGPFATLDEARAQVRTIRSDAAAEVPDAGPTEAPEPEPTEPPRPTKPARSTKKTESVPTPAANIEPAAEPDATEPAPASAASKVARRRPEPAPEPAPPPEPAWLQRLPPDRADEARRLLAILERLDIDDPAIVRREIEANLPEVARTLLVRRLRREVLDPWHDATEIRVSLEDLPSDVRRHLRPLIEPAVASAGRVLGGKGSAEDAAAFAWLVALRTASAVFDVLDSEGDERRVAGEPGWRLLELDGRREPTGRAIAVDTSDLLEDVSD
jgi:hypothetical protein